MSFGSMPTASKTIGSVGLLSAAGMPAQNLPPCSLWHRSRTAQCACCCWSSLYVVLNSTRFHFPGERSRRHNTGARIATRQPASVLGRSELPRGHHFAFCPARSGWRQPCSFLGAPVREANGCQRMSLRDAEGPEPCWRCRTFLLGPELRWAGDLTDGLRLRMNRPNPPARSSQRAADQVPPR